MGRKLKKKNETEFFFINNLLNVLRVGKLIVCSKGVGNNASVGVASFFTLPSINEKLYSQLIVLLLPNK